MDDENRYDPVKYLREPARPDTLEKAALLPGLNTDYKASGTVDNEVSRLVLVMGKDGFRIGSTAYITLQYVHLGIGLLGFTANGQVFSFLFSDLQPKLLTVYGRNLLRIYDYIGLRRMPWIRPTGISGRWAIPAMSRSSRRSWWRTGRGRMQSKGRRWRKR
jgi:hypothetical protein